MELSVNKGYNKLPHLVFPGVQNILIMGGLKINSKLSKNMKHFRFKPEILKESNLPMV